MKKQLSLLTTTSLTSIVIAGSVVAPALAWHPQAEITKSVQDATSKSQTVEAKAAVDIYNKTASSTATQIITVAPGDSLKYVVVVNNPAPAASKKYDDLANALVVDTLPNGVQLTNGTALQSSIADLAPGQSKTFEYDVKVTDQTDGDELTNKACVTGSSSNGDVTGLKACASVIVKVKVPQQPTPTPTPTPTPAPTQPTQLPSTGAGNYIFPAAGITAILGYAGYLLRMKRHAAQR